jgi:hypothetical protein
MTMARYRAAFLVALVFALAAAAYAQTTPGYATPKTPWGDPDLQGIWPGDSAFGIPMQRPESFGTRAELNDKEYADKVARDERARKNALSAVGSFRNDNGWVTKSFRQTSLIIDPPNGPVPPLVAGAEKRRTPLAILQGLGGERAEDKAIEEDAKKGIIRPRRPIQGGLTVGGQPIPEGGPPASSPTSSGGRSYPPN